MNSALKWKLALGLLLAFFAGGATGGFFVAGHAHHRRMDFSPGHHRLADRMRSRMQTELDLTPEQVAKTAPIFDRTASELEKVRTETGARVRQIMAEANRALAPELTDAQRAKLEALKQETRAGRKSRDVRRNRAPKPPD